MNKAKITKEEEIFKKYSVIVEGTIEDNGKTFTREKMVRPDAVCVLLYNIDTESVILVKQHRYPAQRENYSGYLIEVVAGKIDDGESPIDAMTREVVEEVGYKLKPKNIIECYPAFTTPGYSTERIYFYLARVSNKDKVSEGGGCESENENIEVIEMPYLIFKNNMDCFSDLKTRMLAYEAHYKKLFDAKPKKAKKKNIKKDNSVQQEIKF